MPYHELRYGGSHLSQSLSLRPSPIGYLSKEYTGGHKTEGKWAGAKSTESGWKRLESVRVVSGLERKGEYLKG